MSIIEARQPHHAAELFQIMNDPLLYEYIDVAYRPATADALRERIEQNASGKSPDGSQDWLGWVIKNELGHIVGYLTATIHQDGDAHLAYGIGSPFWGKGYARLAAEQLITLLSLNYSIERFCIIAERANTRSVLLAEALGFVEETSDIERQKNELSQSEILLHKYGSLG
jgi:[ribosomal protein S5]-alanine N-acetyltransferase